MALSNEFNDFGKITKKRYGHLFNTSKPSSPPHITEELWEILELEGMLNEQEWPQYDEEKTIDDVIEMPVQVNGKVRGKILIAPR